ncbi:MAG: hypothetical protein UW69_C0021G0005 [Microgenomates group bacterium GW2011_GWA2_44_7]|nr:MAG: hypothetical protein UW69_C0021G0005 [Microgenomates group bacterium GW2011_GWA2_44_7]
MGSSGIVPQLPHAGEVRIIRKKVARVEDAAWLEEYLNELANKLAADIYLVEKIRDEWSCSPLIIMRLSFYSDGHSILMIRKLFFLPAITASFISPAFPPISIRLRGAIYETALSSFTNVI